jgi:GNAT superfamily N-acetyltransferase
VGVNGDGRASVIGKSAAVALRLATKADVATAARIVPAALNDLYSRQSRALLDDSGDGAAPVLGHLLRHDAARFWVAEAAEGVVGFSVGMHRGDLWFLAGLFVLPGWQGRGLGHALLERAMAGCPGPEGVAAVLSSAANEVSNRLYARRGMRPMLPVLSLVGPLPLKDEPALAQGLIASPLSSGDLAALRDVDSALLGFDRTVDHAWLLGEAGRVGWLFSRQRRPVAYAYVGGDGTEGETVIGPAAADRVEDMAGVVAYALAQLAAAGFHEGSVMVSGANVVVQRMLWDAGFMFHGATGLLGASRPLAGLDRYVFFGNALM